MKIIISIFISAFFLINFQLLKSDFPVIIGDASKEYFTQAPSIPLYIGDLTDTIVINQKLQFDYDWTGYEEYRNPNRKFRDTENAKVDIFVNSKQDLNTTGKESKYKFIPVLIKNQEKDTIIIGETNYIPIILEAKDENNEWKPIDDYISYFCGTGIYSILLYPNHVVLTKFELPKEGDYYTKLRVKLGQNYSKEFGGIIQEKWFEERRYSWRF
jgi:hypothetical protein